MAGTVPEITARALVIERGLEVKPIYFAKVGGVSIVIKGESTFGMTQLSDSDRGISIKWTSKLMKNVNNKLVNTKILTPAEVQIFKSAALQKFGMGTPQRKHVDGTAGNFKWVKMPLVGGLSDANFIGEGFGAKPVQSKVKKLIAKFTDETLWPPLGKILAVDIFNGNNDRFHTEDGDWVNFGNVMFLDGGDTSIIGLDTFDPNSDIANLNAANAPGSLQSLRKLTDPVQRNEYARKVTHSVGERLANFGLGKGIESVTIPLNTPDGMKAWTVTKAEVVTLYEGFSPLVAAGIERGANQLKTYLQNKVRQYRQQNGPPRPLPVLPGTHRVRGGLPLVRPNVGPARPGGIPQGIWDRMVFLGWAV